MKSLSYSALTTYSNCFYQYKLIYIDKVVPVQLKLTKRGSDFHEFADKFFSNYIIIDNKLHPKIPVSGNILTEVKNFLAYEQNRYEHLSKNDLLKFYQPTHLEYEFRNERLGLHGFVDRCEDNPDGSMSIYDYKTGNPDLSGVKKQLAFYTLGLEESINGRDVVWMCLMVSKGELFTSPARKDVLSTVHELVVKARQGIEGGNFNKFATKMESCYPCQVKAYCPRFEVISKPKGVPYAKDNIFSRP